jgi:hypothetical protein
MFSMRVARMIRASLALAGAALIGFHGWLFAGQIAAAGLVAALVAVRRSGETILGRKSIAIWVLAALLHGPAIASDLQTDFNSFALPETVATSVLQLVSSAALGVSLWLLAGLLLASRRAAQSRYATVPVLVTAGGRAPVLLRRFAPRPPPIRS